MIEAIRAITAIYAPKKPVQTPLKSRSWQFQPNFASRSRLMKIYCLFNFNNLTELNLATRNSPATLGIEGSPALSDCLMSIWWAHQSSSGGADCLFP
jgi:hypothetical protein